MFSMSSLHLSLARFTMTAAAEECSGAPHAVLEEWCYQVRLVAVDCS